MKKSLFIITALLLLAGTSCQKTDTVEPTGSLPEMEKLETRSENFTISGPSSMARYTYTTFSVLNHSSGHYYHWSCPTGDIVNDSDEQYSSSPEIEVGGFYIKGTAELFVYVYEWRKINATTYDYVCIGSGYKEINVY